MTDAIVPDVGSWMVAADQNGRLHLFWTINWAFKDKSTESPMIHHEVQDRSGWSTLPSVSTEGNYVEALKAVPGPGGISLMWLQEWSRKAPANSTGKYRPPSIFLRELGGDGRGDSELVSDDGAYLEALLGDVIDLTVNEQGITDVFWVDLRVRNFLRGLATMGEDSEVPKIFHRHKGQDEWSEAERSCVHESSDVDNLSAVEDSSGRIHLFWYKSLDSGVYYASIKDGTCSKTEVLGRAMRGFDGGRPFVLWVRAARGMDGGVYVTWLWSRFVSKSDEEGVLELCRVEGDRCAEKSVLSRDAGGFAWANGPNGASGLLLQEYPHSRAPAYPYISPRRRPTYPVYFVPITASGPGAKRVIDDHVMDGWFSGATDANGVLHFIYLNEEADGIFSFMHRWAPDPLTWSDANSEEPRSEGR